MTIAFLVGVLAAIVVGLRFKVLLVLPIVAGEMLFAGMAMFARGEPGWTILSAVVFNAIGIQIAYILATLALSLLRDLPTHEPAAAPTTNSLQLTGRQS